MATSTLSNFKTALTHSGARPSLFDVSVTPPTALKLGTIDEMKTFCNVTAIPPLTVTPIERQYFGRTVKIPGDMVFGDLSTTIMNTEKYPIRDMVDEWMDGINTHVGNISYSDNASWQGTVTLTQYSKEGKSLMVYTFEDCWPQTVSEIALSYDTASDIETFDITWAYNYYTSKPGDSTNVTTTYATQV